MADPRRFELEDLVLRPGTYFNPETEVLLVVDDSPAMDQEIFGADDPDSADWVLVADEVPVDEHRRDELVEAFQVTYHPGTERTLTASEDLEDDPSVHELEPDEDVEPES